MQQHTFEATESPELEDLHLANDNEYAKSGHIKKVQNPQADIPSKPQQKRPFIEPGTPCQQFEEILSTTVSNENGLTTHFVAKALTGPALHFASQMTSGKQASTKPSKEIPELPKGISGELGPHLHNYATITHEGIYRKTNEDKLTIFLDDEYKWFSIYDGHGGSACSQFMKDHLHEEFFALDWTKDVANCLRKAFINVEQSWRKRGDDSGSCALVIFIYQNVCYAANLGDSRAILISQGGKKCYQITKDHKPSNPKEQERIFEAGGKIYQTTAYTELKGKYDMIVGPLRVFPGRLSTTRTFGDFEAKDSQADGNQRVVICQPEISSFYIEEHDQIIMGSDGLWDRHDNVEISELFYRGKENGLQGEEWLARSTEVLLEESLRRGSTDNISVIIIGLNDPNCQKEPRKGNEHIKIMGSLNGNALGRKQTKNKENSYPAEKLKKIDSRISEINRNAERINQPRR